MKSLLVILSVLVVISCSSAPIERETKIVNMKFEGNIAEVVVEEEHPCEGNWNFCDHVLDQLSERQ